MASRRSAVRSRPSSLEDEPTFVTLTSKNIAEEHLCCALGDPKHQPGVGRKKAWLKRRIKEGLVFRKLAVRGKVFIEYMPAEQAWRPIAAPGWLTIHCLWVSGRYAGRGYARRLVEDCIRDARRQGKHGVVVASAMRKRPFLSDPKFLKHLGFTEVDPAGEFRLFARRVKAGGQEPRFTLKCKTASDRFVARYTDQCPFNAHWAQEMADGIRGRGYDVDVERITTRAKAQRVASPLGTFGLERGGELVTHHLNTPGAVSRLLGSR